MSLNDRLELIGLINSAQNDLNSFVNINDNDLEVIYNHFIKHDLSHDELVQLLIDLAYV